MKSSMMTRPLHDYLLIPWEINVGSDGADFKTLHASGDGPEAIARGGDKVHPSCCLPIIFVIQS